MGPGISFPETITYVFVDEDHALLSIIPTTNSF